MKILDFNHCNLEGCKCGWNITIGGSSEEELSEIREWFTQRFLSGKPKIKDATPYHEKINQEKF